MLARPAYRRLWGARTVSQAGDVAQFTTLALLVFHLTGSGLGVSGVVAAEIAPVLLLAPAAGAFNDTEILGRMAMERMLGGLSTRRYGVGLEPVGEQVAASATATSRSAVSRRFVAMTETALADMLAADLSKVDLVALMVDGVHFAESCCVVALGIDIDGTKHPLAVVEGSTENSTLVTELCVGLRERGLDVTRPILAVLDGSKALRRAVRDVFDHPVIARCQLHKIRINRPSRAGSRVGLAA